MTAHAPEPRTGSIVTAAPDTEVQRVKIVSNPNGTGFVYRCACGQDGPSRPTSLQAFKYWEWHRAHCPLRPRGETEV